MGVVAKAMREKLEAAFSPDRLEVQDDSDKHAGHSGAAEGGESHFTIVIQSDAFLGVPRVQRQRRVYGVLAEELAGPVHALSVRALAPGEV
jgi:BolA protein